MKTYLLNFLYALDLLCNALFFGACGQTISARWGASRTKVWLFYWGCQVLDRIQIRHCETAAERYARIKSEIE
jgi:hypothetical protein